MHPHVYGMPAACDSRRWGLRVAGASRGASSRPPPPDTPIVRRRHAVPLFPARYGRTSPAGRPFGPPVVPRRRIDAGVDQYRPGASVSWRRLNPAAAVAARGAGDAMRRESGTWLGFPDAEGGPIEGEPHRVAPGRARGARSGSAQGWTGGLRARSARCGRRSFRLRPSGRMPKSCGAVRNPCAAPRRQRCAWTSGTFRRVARRSLGSIWRPVAHPVAESAAHRPPFVCPAISAQAARAAAIASCVPLAFGVHPIWGTCSFHAFAPEP